MFSITSADITPSVIHTHMHTHIHTCTHHIVLALVYILLIKSKNNIGSFLRRERIIFGVSHIPLIHRISLKRKFIEANVFHMHISRNQWATTRHSNNGIHAKKLCIENNGHINSLYCHHILSKDQLLQWLE